MKPEDRIDKYLDDIFIQYREMNAAYFRITSYIGKIKDLNPDKQQQERLSELETKINKKIDMMNRMRLPKKGTHQKE